MTDLIDLVSKQLDAGTLAKISSQLGAKPSSTQNAIESAVPLLIAAMNRNASKPQGAQQLASALERDHDGSMLDHLSGFLNKGPSSSDNRIADHLLGSKRDTAERGIGQASGLSSDTVSKLMATLGPIVMAAASKQMTQNGGLGGLLESLGSSESKAKQSSGGSVLSSLLDGDGDGDVDIADLTKLGGGLLGRFL